MKPTFLTPVMIQPELGFAAGWSKMYELPAPAAVEQIVTIMAKPHSPTGPLSPARGLAIDFYRRPDAMTNWADIPSHRYNLPLAQDALGGYPNEVISVSLTPGWWAMFLWNKDQGYGLIVSVQQQLIEGHA